MTHEKGRPRRSHAGVVNTQQPPAATTATSLRSIPRLPDIAGFQLRALARAAQWRREGDLESAQLLEWLAAPMRRSA